MNNIWRVLYNYLFYWWPGFRRSNTPGENLGRAVGHATGTTAPHLDRWPLGSICEIFAREGEYQVIKIWNFREGSYRWVEYEMINLTNHATISLYVMLDDGEWVLVLYDEEVNLDNPKPFLDQDPPLKITVQGEIYHFDESGTVHSTLTTDEITNGQPETAFYADYEGDGNARFGVEVYGNEIEAWLGTALEKRHVTYVGQTSIVSED